MSLQNEWMWQEMWQHNKQWQTQRRCRWSKQGRFWGRFWGSKRGRKKGQKRAVFWPPRKTWSASYGQKTAKNAVLGGRTARGLYFCSEPRKWPKIDVFGVFWRPLKKWPILSTNRKQRFHDDKTACNVVEQHVHNVIEALKNTFWGQGGSNGEGPSGHENRLVGTSNFGRRALSIVWFGTVIQDDRPHMGITSPDRVAWTPKTGSQK